MTDNPLRKVAAKTLTYVNRFKAYNQHYYAVMEKVNEEKRVKETQLQKERATRLVVNSSKLQAIGLALMAFGFAGVLAVITDFAWFVEGNAHYPKGIIFWFMGLFSMPSIVIGFIVSAEAGIFRSGKS